MLTECSQPGAVGTSKVTVLSLNLFITKTVMAERQGFEPWVPFRVHTLSKRAPSATRPSLRSALIVWRESWNRNLGRSGADSSCLGREVARDIQDEVSGVRSECVNRTVHVRNDRHVRSNSSIHSIQG